MLLLLLLLLLVLPVLLLLLLPFLLLFLPAPVLLPLLLLPLPLLLLQGAAGGSLCASSEGDSAERLALRRSCTLRKSSSVSVCFSAKNASIL